MYFLPYRDQGSFSHGNNEIIRPLRELVALLGLSSWCLVMVVGLFLAVPCVYLRFVIVVFPDHTDLLFSSKNIGIFR